MLLLPGPRTVLSTARSTAGALLGVPARLLTLVTRAESALDRVDALLDSVAAIAARADLAAARAESVVTRADAVAGRAALVVGTADAVATDAAGVVSRAGEVAGQAAGVVGQAEEVAGTAAGVVGRADEVAGRAAGVVTGAGETERTAAALLSAYEPVLRQLRPALARLAETVDPHEVEAMVALVDRLPALADSVDTDVLPLLAKLNDIAPDLHALLEAVEDVRSAIAGLPGIGRLMRRGDDQISDPETRPGETHGATRA